MLRYKERNFFGVLARLANKFSTPLNSKEAVKIVKNCRMIEPNKYENN